MVRTTKFLRNLQVKSLNLCTFFNYSLNLGSFPSPRKDANISPISKKGDLFLLTNHRPVSLLNAESKVFERLVFKHLLMSLVVRKPAFCISENKDADQLSDNRTADQRLCFRYTDSTITLLP